MNEDQKAMYSIECFNEIVRACNEKGIDHNRMFIGAATFMAAETAKESKRNYSPQDKRYMAVAADVCGKMAYATILAMQKEGMLPE